MFDKITEKLSQPIEINFWSILLFIIFIILSIAVLLVAFKSFSACCRYNKRNKYPFFHIGHIILYGIISAYFTLRGEYINDSIYDYVPKAVIILIITVLFAFPTIINIVKCGFTYGIQYTIWQMLFGLIFCALIYGIIAFILIAAAVLIGASGNEDENQIRLTRYGKGTFPARMISATQAVDYEGNHYHRIGDYFYDDDNNQYWEI